MTHPSPLLGTLERRGATVIGYGPPDRPIELVDTFGELDFEYAALRKACVLIDAPHRATIDITGDDRLGFLNNMITQELKGVEPLECRRSFWLGRKGRIVSDPRVIVLEDRVRFDLDVHAAAATLESLGSYVIAEDVELTDATAEVHRLALHGPTGPALIDAVRTDDGERAASLAGRRALWAEIAGARTLVTRDDTAGEIGLELSVPGAHAAAVYDALVSAGAPDRDPDAALNGEPAEEANPIAREVRLRASGWLAYNTARIEAGTPLFLLDFGTDALPAETGEATLADRVSFKKGCYLGQEVVARMHSLGKPKQTLVSIRLEGDNRRDEQGFCRQPIGGEQLLRGDEPVGVITSSTVSPMLGGEVAAFAMVRTKALDAAGEDGGGFSVVAEGSTVSARVSTDLRYYSNAKN